MAPEVIALVQPNSFSIGLKKTPKANCRPNTAAIIKKAATTTI